MTITKPNGGEVPICDYCEDRAVVHYDISVEKSTITRDIRFINSHKSILPAIELPRSNIYACRNHDTMLMSGELP